MNEERLFKLILRHQRYWYKPAVHSFVIAIENGTAYVECRQEVYIETRQCSKNGIDKVTQWCGTAVAAANRLEKLHADISSVELMLPDVMRELADRLEKQSAEIY